MKNIWLARKDEEGVEMFLGKIHLRNGGSEKELCTRWARFPIEFYGGNFSFIDTA